MSQGIWYIYDGDCPVCHYAAHAFRAKQKYGELHLVDAREMPLHPLIKEATRRQLSLDEGMLIVADGHFYHGKTALRFMAQCGEAKGIFNLFNKALFWSSILRSMLYPLMRGTRNLLLKLRGKDQINNLNKARP